jgi:uncharacterized membrane protein
MMVPESRELFRPERLLAFSDGVFGVAITLLVIDLQLPPLSEGGGDPAFVHALASMLPKLLVFGFTFIIIGMSWLGHHRKFSYIERVDERLLWLNLLYLMALCLVPFVSRVFAEHGGNRFAFALYAAVMAMLELFSVGLSAYGLRTPFLTDSMRLSPRLRQDIQLAPFLVGIIFLLGAGLALGGMTKPAHWVLLMIVPIMAFFGGRAQKAATPGPLGSPTRRHD